MASPFLALIGYYDHDVSWAQRLHIPHVIYYKDQPHHEPFNARNKGKDETNLLKFISDFYDDLPENIINLHQYERKYTHPGSLVDILNNASFTQKYAASKTPGYWAFAGDQLESSPEQYQLMLASGWWNACMKPTFGPIGSCGDFIQGKTGSSQFVVSRERIHSLPREFYVNMYNWIVENALDEESTQCDMLLNRIKPATWTQPNSNHYMSCYLQWSWELIFTAYKPHEIITSTLPVGRHLSATYGYGNYHRNVTAEFIRIFCKYKGLVKLPRCILNEHFGDHVPNCLKTLRISLDGNVIEINEAWMVTL